MNKIEIIRWAPNDLCSEDIMRIIQNYGTDNDSIMSEKYDVNTVSWIITISIEKI